MGVSWNPLQLLHLQTYQDLPKRLQPFHLELTVSTGLAPDDIEKAKDLVHAYTAEHNLKGADFKSDTDKARFGSSRTQLYKACRSRLSEFEDSFNTRVINFIITRELNKLATAP